MLLTARENGATIFFMGNGGSAATASHFANDLAFGTNEYEKPFKVMSITDNVPVITALGNDYGYDEIFVRRQFYQRLNIQSMNFRQGDWLHER